MMPKSRSVPGLKPLFCMVLVLATGTTFVQTVPAQEPQPRVFRLELREMDGIEHGRAAVVKGNAASEAQRFLVEGVTMETPVTVLLRGLDPDDDIDLSVTKYAWDQPLKRGTARDEPLALKFRTEGEFQLSVTSDDDGAPYRLLVWVGDVVEPALAPVAVSVDEFEDAPAAAAIGSGGGFVLWVIAGLLGAAVCLLAVLVLWRKS